MYVCMIEGEIDCVSASMKLVRKCVFNECVCVREEKARCA